jgi:hypothetical protein
MEPSCSACKQAFPENKRNRCIVLQKVAVAADGISNIYMTAGLFAHPVQLRHLTNRTAFDHDPKGTVVSDWATVRQHPKVKCFNTAKLFSSWRLLFYFLFTFCASKWLQ